MHGKVLKGGKSLLWDFIPAPWGGWDEVYHTYIALHHWQGTLWSEWRWGGTSFLEEEVGSEQTLVYEVCTSLDLDQNFMA